ncbi:hypothetical protein A6F68_01812 [Tsuneonella dongtanensis]|uniref:Uncharacterized protein n=2 Tax=Tsuneonella dongtanensis TaxID=692370 RepID=A0A1B2ADT7_9SPHN|nr:hypothetical protein A6F68_01812 [Tsuneonella dongtanensis]
MDVIGWLEEASGSRWLEPGDVALRWLAGPRTFAATFPVYGSGQLVDDPDNLARSANYLVDSGNRRLAATHFYIPGVPNAISQLTLLGSFFGADRKSKPFGTFVYFPRSAIRAPTTGQVTYTIPERYTDGTRLSNATLAVDFGTGTVFGKVSVTYTDAFGPYPETLYDIENGRVDRSTGRITGTFRIPGSGFDGTVRGQVLGAQGQVAAVVARGAVRDPYEGQWRESFQIAGFLNEQSTPIS